MGDRDRPINLSTFDSTLGEAEVKEPSGLERFDNLMGKGYEIFIAALALRLMSQRSHT
jgi:hypothetical protein